VLLVYYAIEKPIDWCIVAKETRKATLDQIAFPMPELLAIRNDIRAAQNVSLWARCVVPECDGASLILSRQEEDALWEVFFTAAPARRRVYEPNSKRRKKAPGLLPPATA
jgi:hypothetical protein